MTDKKPIVSICMPVYNGERFIRQALDSLLAQDYENFELIISDNASIDRTQEICLGYMTKDKRIQYYRNEINLGAIKNFYHAFELSRGKYFMFAADHDLWHHTFISRCVSILEKEPKFVLAYSRTMYIDMLGKPIRIISNRIDNTKDMPIAQRYRHLTSNLVYCEMFYGLIRREIFPQTDPGGVIWPFDRLLLSQLALKGGFTQINEPLFYLRKTHPDETHEIRKNRGVYGADPASAAKNCKHSVYYFYSRLYFAHIKMLLRYNMSNWEKLDLIGYTIFEFLICIISTLYYPMVLRIGSMLRRKGILKNSYAQCGTHEDKI